MMSTASIDRHFAAIDCDGELLRFAGGNETDVYLSDDRRLVVKIKTGAPADRTAALADAGRSRCAAERFAACVGARHAIPSAYLIVGDAHGRPHVLAVQPFLAGARALAAVDLAGLSRVQRRAIGLQLLAIIGRSARHYLTHGEMPDLYGQRSADQGERAARRGLAALPARCWSFLVERSLLRSHNLVVTDEREPRLVLVDYDTVQRGALYRAVYFTARIALFGRDLPLILWILAR